VKLENIAQTLSLEVRAAAEKLDVDVTGGYVCDLLSYVMGKAKAGDLWITVQGHPNIVAVASLIGLSGIVVVEGSKVEPATVEKAEQEGIPILTTPLQAYEVAGKLWELGVK
jgi:hypothetical protein